MEAKRSPRLYLTTQRTVALGDQSGFGCVISLGPIALESWIQFLMRPLPGNRVISTEYRPQLWT